MQFNLGSTGLGLEKDEIFILIQKACSFLPLRANFIVLNLALSSPIHAYTTRLDS